MNELIREQSDIIEKARSISKGIIASNAGNVDENSEFPKASLDALGEAGFLGLMVPKEYGGMGQGLRTMAAVLEEIAKECSSTALCYLVHLGGAAAYAAAEPPKEGLLRAVAQGRHLSTLALGEFGSRSHFWAPMSRAEKQDSKIVLDAAKSFVTSAGQTDGYVVITRSVESDAPTETSFYYVSAKENGLKVSSSWDALGMRGNASAPMRFEQVVVSSGDALSKPGEGMGLLLETLLPIINLGVAAICLGIAEASIAITRQHLMKSELEHLSMKLADLPNERARLARMRMEADKARAHLAATFDALERASESATLWVLESKVVAADMVLGVTDTAMKAVGGTAFNRRMGLERRFRDARAADVTGVTSDLLLEFIGRALLDMPIP
jgi:alkylation response protein AidB-like acyl-CoA dehydrogenase